MQDSLLRIPRRGLLGLGLVCCCLLVGGCWSESGPEVIAYTALDEQFSDPIFEDFSQETGITVRTKYDTESTKTVGLVADILKEQARPRCDVFWNNEIINTLRLEKKGLLEPCHPAVANKYPAMYRSPKGNWHGFAAQARVLIVNTDKVPAARRPRSILDLADPKWRGRTAMAKPLFGTTATHAACLFAAWGPSRAKKFFEDLKKNEVQILSGNKQVAENVASGALDFGLTDTDDALIEFEKGMPVEIVYPDQGAGQLGTLFIPTTLAIIKGGAAPGRRPAAGRVSAFGAGGNAAGQGGKRADSAEHNHRHEDSQGPRRDPADRASDGGRFREGGRPVGCGGRVYARPVYGRLGERGGRNGEGGRMNTNSRLRTFPLPPSTFPLNSAAPL